MNVTPAGAVASSGVDTRRAIAEFEAARDLDPDFAPAYAGLATAATQLRVRFAAARDADTWDARARQEAGWALQLDPNLAEAHVALAAVHRFQEYDWDTVIRESRRAIELSPSLDLPHLYRVEPLEIRGAIHLFAGHGSEAVRDLSEATVLSDSRIAKYLLGWASYYEGERQRAEAMLESMVADEGPVPGNARATLAALRAARGATADARHLAEQVASEPDLLHHAAYGLGTAYAQLHGDRFHKVISRRLATMSSCSVAPIARARTLSRSPAPPLSSSRGVPCIIACAPSDRSL